MQSNTRKDTNSFYLFIIVFINIYNSFVYKKISLCFSESNPCKPVYDYIKLRQFTESCLIFPNENVISLLDNVTAFMDKHKNNIMSHNQPRKSLLNTFKQLSFGESTCHDLKNLLLKKYINTKIHFWSKKIVSDPIIRSSKSVSAIMQR
jgi:hypothetical protein